MAGTPVERALRNFLDELVERGEVSGFAAAIADSQRIEWRHHGGYATRRPRLAATARTRWDLASLTKPVMATLALALDSARLLPLRSRVGDVFPRAAESMRRMRLEALLRHRSGLRAWAPLAAQTSSREEALDLLLCGHLRSERAGRCVYSDLGYILWGFAAERALATGLDELVTSHVARPLRMRGLGAFPRHLNGVAESRLDNAREIELAAAQGFSVPSVPKPPRGWPQDGNARFLGAWTGHAGLFGTVDDIVRFGQEWLRPGRVLDQGQVRYALTGRGEYALGWARRRIRGSAGPELSRRAFGHTGFTGTSLWIDPKANRILVLLAHRTSAVENLNAGRREFHRLALSFLPT